MSTGTGILALLGGMRQGERDAAERARQEEERRQADERANLSLWADLSRLPGFSIGNGGAAPGAPGAPPPIDFGALHSGMQSPPSGAAQAPAAPQGPQAPGLSSGPMVNQVAPAVGLRSPALEAARQAMQGMAGTPVAPQAPQAPEAPPRAPGSIVDLGSLTVGGAPRSISFDPSQTAAAQARAERSRRDARNRSAYQELDAADPGSQGEYDPDFDYMAEARKEREVARYEEMLITQRGYSPGDAREQARYHVDIEAKRQKDEELRLRRQDAAQKAEVFRASQAEQKISSMADEAAGYLSSGMKPENLGATLHVVHPEASVADITRAVGMARSAAELQAANIAQKTRSGSGGGGLTLGGITIDPSTLGGAQDTTLPPLDAEARAKAASDPGFAAWLRSKGYQF